MEIRSAVVLRMAKDIEYVKKTSNAKQPSDYEDRFIELGRPRGLTYCGLVGEFKGANTKAAMKCKNLAHRYFTTKVGHLNEGKGCPECGKAKARSKTRNNSDVVLTEVNKECEKRGDIKFICFDGGYINVTAKNLKYDCLNGHGEHLTSLKMLRNGVGCPECARIKRISSNTVSFGDAMEMVNEVCDRTGTLKFSRFEGGYSGVSEENLYMDCLTHSSEFKTSVSRLYSGQGCRRCGIERRAEFHRKEESEVINAINEECSVNRLNYGNPLFIGGYVGNHTRNLQLECFDCETPFLTSYSKFMTGRGCPSCAMFGFNKSKPGYVYIQRISGEINAGKIGITNKNPVERMKQHARSSRLSHEIIFTHYFEDGSKVWEVERFIKTALKEHMGYVPRELMGDGFTETFPAEMLPMVSLNVRSLCRK